jgi:hypothetical protein
MLARGAAFGGVRDEKDQMVIGMGIRFDRVGARGEAWSSD